MIEGDTLFDLFGGIRPTARALGESPATVHGWKRVGRVPAEKQPHVLAVAQALGLSITAENIVFPLGRPSDVATTLTAKPASVACPPQSEAQRTEAVR
jgi:hypothetical protein